MGRTRFGELIRQRRQGLGLTREDLAERTGVSVRGIRDIETGRARQPRPSTVRLLAEALGLDLQDARRAAGPILVPPG